MTCVGAKPMLLLAWRRDLGANFFAGTIPETIAEMTALRRVYVVDCFAFRLAHFSCFAQDPAQHNLTGLIPSTIGKLMSLDYLFVVAG
jgi:hypothetical protein